jgi:hypothetical protein
MESINDVIKTVSSLDILKIYNLAEYDRNMALLYNDLQQFLNDWFQGNPTSFKHNERIVFVHTDLDYFINDQFPPFTLYNLQLILRELDISNFFCIVISNLPNYNKYSQLTKNLLTTDTYAIKTVNSLYPIVYKFHPVNDHAEIQSITKPFCIQSRLSRFHRTYFISQVFKSNLQNYGYVAYHNISWDILNPNNQSDSLISCPCYFLTTVPYVRTNTELVIRHNENQECVRLFQQHTTSYINYVEDIDIKNKTLSSISHSNVLKQSLIYVGLETTAMSPEVFLSQIAFKSMAQKRPFILLGDVGIIEYLQELGFKTFDAWWSEDYSQESNFETRVNKIIYILNQWKNKSQQELQSIAHEMSSVLEHNFLQFNNIVPRQRQFLIEQLQSS